MIFRWESMMDHDQDQRHVDMFFREQFARLERKKCDRILCGKVAIGMSTGRMHPPHLQQIGGSQENGTNHNKENGNISNGGKRGKYSLFDPSVILQDSCSLANVVQLTEGEDSTLRRA